MSHERVSLDALEQAEAFARRHIGPRETDKQAMLKVLGLASMDDLVKKVVPSSIISQVPLSLEKGRTEQQALADLRGVAAKNKVYKPMIGMGYYNCHTPSVILRNVLENPAWYTAYTPYQPEISQGRLEALLNFQTMVADLTGMEIANASLLDEGTAAAEAMALCLRLSDSGSKAFFVSSECHPQTIEVVRTRAAPIGVEVIVGDHRQDFEGTEVFGALVQYPASTGEIFDYADFVKKAHAKRALVTVAADLLSLALLAPPAEFGADVVVGTSTATARKPRCCATCGCLRTRTSRSIGQ